MSESSYPSDKQDKFVLRLPDGMRDRIKSAAEAANRSMNAEIVARLEASFSEMSSVDADFVRAIVDRTIDNMLSEGFVLPAKRGGDSD